MTEEIPALIEALHRTERRLGELTAGEVDAVTNSEGRTFLLRRAQDQLRHREAVRQAAILDALPAHIALLDTEGRIVAVNGAWRRFARANAIQGPGHGIGADYLGLCDSARGDGAIEARQAAAGIRSVLDGRAQSFSIEYPCHSPTEQRWFLMTVTLLADDPSAGAVVMHLNVTAEKQADQNLRASELRFRQITESIRDVFFLVDVDSNRVLYISPAYEKIWGRSCASLYANPESWTETIHPDDRASIYRKCRQGLRAGKFKYEYRIVRPDGSIRWMETRGFPVRDDAGRVVRIAGVAEDVTERRQATQALRESERRHSDMLGNVALASVMLDREARITFCNEHLLRLTGRRREEVIGRNWFELFIPPEIDGDMKVVFEKLLANLPEVSHHENEILSRSGERRLIRWNNTVLRSAAGDVTGTASIGEDITGRKRAENRIMRLNRIYAVLSGINGLIVRVRDRETLFDGACRIAIEEGQFPFAWVGVLDHATLDVTAIAWAGEGAETLVNAKFSAREDTPQGRGAVGRSVRERRPVVNNDIKAHGFGGPRLQEILRLGFQSQITLPLYEGQAIVGTLTMYAKESNFFDEPELRLLTQLAGDISFAIENIGKQQKLDKLTRIRAVSREVNASIIRIHDRDALLREICRIAVEHGKFEVVWIALLDQGKQRIQPIAWSGVSSGIAHALTWADASSMPGATLPEVLQTRKVAVRHDIDAEAPAGALRQEAIRKGYRSTICLPFMVDDSVVAAIILFAAGRDFLDEEERELLNEVAADVSFALQAIKKQEKLDYLSYYDVLTGLANRSLFLDRVAQHIRSAVSGGHKLALFMIDLERFKSINDSLGQPAGDALLRQVAEWLTRHTGDASLVSRVGADHFAVVLPEVRQDGDLARLLDKSMAAFMVHPFRLDDAVYRIAAKAGAALYPDDGADADALFRNAEAALKKAKAGGDRYLYYAQRMTETVASTLTLENQLRQAFEKEEFVLHYQPKMNLVSGKVTGAEALIRWNDPSTGLVPPGRFIPVLEEIGLIYEVGRWALRKALEDHLRWRSAGLAAMRIAVNVSPLQLRSRRFAAEIEQVIGIDAHAAAGLELELTENLIMQDFNHSVTSLQAIRAMGVRIAIDDFGTGFSSLSYLSKLPVDTLKIDRSFVLDMTLGPEGLALVSTIITLAHALRLSVVAEGVETSEQSRLLRLLNCDEMQGYLFSEPLPASIFETRFLATPSVV